jgi:hypothetical protein
MEIFFKILAVILGGVAAYFLWTGNADRAFASAVFGAVSFFLSVRVEVKKRNTIREAERLREEEEKERRGEGEFEEFDDEEEFGDDNLNDEEAPQLNEMPAKEQFEPEIPNPKGERKI